MKKLLFLMLLLAIATTSLAKKNRNAKNPIIGTWKYTNESVKNDFQQVKVKIREIYQSEFFTFFIDNKFKHEFLDADGNAIKVLRGKWKSVDDKITITYTDIDYNLNLTYFFLDKDLVLGQNFNHIIFTNYDKNLEEKNIALK